MNGLHETLDSVFIKGPQLSNDSISAIGDSLILVPHADDESLACGGTIAILRKMGHSVRLVFITDGTMSHPNSMCYPSEKLQKLREREAIEALGILEVEPSAIRFLRLPDSKMNELDPLSFIKNSNIIKTIFLELKPKTILLPWRKDPHPDHVATWKLGMHALSAACETNSFNTQVLEYPVWFWERTNEQELFKEGKVSLWKISILEELIKKKQAIAKHASQLGKIIKDDPSGFSLSEDMLQHFNYPEEVFFQYPDALKKRR